MLTQSTPMPERDHIAGLIDGSIVLQQDSAGGLSLQVTLGPTGPEHGRHGPLLEIGLAADAVEHLASLLLSDGEKTMTVRCHVGVRAREI